MNNAAISSLNKGLLLSAFTCFILFCFSCKKDGLPPSSVGITSFVLLQDSSVVVQSTTVIKGDSLLITVPATTNLSGLTTRIGLAAGATISPGSGVHQDFTGLVSYTVTLGDGVTKNYIVKVTLDKLKNMVFVGTTNGILYALDATSGKSFWTQSTGGNFSYSSPVVGNRIVYAGNTDGNMYAYKATLGNPVWSYKTGSSIESSAALSGGNLYFGSDDHYFLFVKCTNGRFKLAVFHRF